MDSITFIAGKNVTYDHIAQAIQLDKLVYDELYHLDLSTCVDYFDTNPSIYFMALNSNGDVIGYANFSPIAPDIYKLIKSGNVVDTVISRNEIVPYKCNQMLYGYFSSIVVHPLYRNHGLGTALIKNVLAFLSAIAKRDNVIFCEVVADAISIEGERFLTKIGFKNELNSTHNSKIMVLKPLSEMCVKTELNRELIKTYQEMECK